MGVSQDQTVEAVFKRLMTQVSQQQAAFAGVIATCHSSTCLAH